MAATGTGIPAPAHISGQAPQTVRYQFRHGFTAMPRLKTPCRFRRKRARLDGISHGIAKYHPALFVCPGRVVHLPPTLHVPIPWLRPVRPAAEASPGCCLPVAGQPSCHAEPAFPDNSCRHPKRGHIPAAGLSSPTVQHSAATPTRHQPDSHARPALHGMPALSKAS